MARSSAYFLVPSSMERRIISMGSAIRKKFGDGPYIFVHTQTKKKFSKEQINKAFSERNNGSMPIRLPWVDGKKSYKLALKKNQHMDNLLDMDGCLSVVLVEISSWSKNTTNSMIQELWDVAITPEKLYREYLTIVVNHKYIQSVVAIVIGSGGKNLRATIRQSGGQGRAYINRNECPTRFIIESTTKTDAIKIKVAIERKIEQVTKDVQRRSNETHSKRQHTSSSTISPNNRFGALMVTDDDEPSTNTTSYSEKMAIEPKPYSYTTSENSCWANGNNLAKSLNIDSLSGITFADTPTNINMIKKTTKNPYDEEELPEIIKKSSDEDLFDAIARTVCHADWNME